MSLEKNVLILQKSKNTMAVIMNWQTQSRQSKSKSKADDLVFIKIAILDLIQTTMGVKSTSNVQIDVQLKIWKKSTVIYWLK